MALRPSLDPLSKLIGLPRNPKQHDLGSLHASLDSFSFLDRILINDVTGHLVAGHGRIDALRQRKARGLPPPGNVTTDGGGEWLIPADHVELAADREEAAAVALNRTTELGGWDEPLLAQVLADLAAGPGLNGSGFDTNDLDALLADLGLQQKASAGDQRNEVLPNAEVIICPSCGAVITNLGVRGT